MNSVKERLCYCPVIGSIYSVVFSWLVSVLMIRMQISHFSCSLSAGMQTCYQTQQHLDTPGWRRTGNSVVTGVFFFLGGDEIVSSELCKSHTLSEGIPRLGAVTGCYSHSEYVGMGVRMGGGVLL